MRDDPRTLYRDRIYGRYVTANQTPLAPRDLEGLRPRFPYFKWMIKTCFPADRQSRILELGCGHGALVHVLQGAGYRRVEGVDSSQEQVEAARRLGIEGVRKGDAMEVLGAIPAASVDVVVTFDLIEHLGKVELIRFVDEVRRVLFPGGQWLIHVPNAESPFGASIRYGDFTHEVAFTRHSVVQLLLASGFQDVKCFEDEPVVHGPASLMRKMLWKVIRSTLLLYTAIETGALDRGAVFSRNMLVSCRVATAKDSNLREVG